MAAVQSYPVRVDATLDAPLSRWLWLIKWVLVIPHYIMLTFLWLAFVVLSAVAFVAILFTGSYPKSIFEFNVGVLRWTWRVQYYAIGAFGTDQYPPFTLAEVPGYPAHLEISYPERLSRGLVLVKWWLLAIPHYLIVGLFAGGGFWFAWETDRHNWILHNPTSPGLIGLLAIVAAVVLLVTGRYPRQIFDLVLGLNRWVLRVAAYAGLMTDQYPPFRLDLGGSDPASTLTLSPPRSEPRPPAVPEAPGSGQGPRPGWTAGRVTCAVIGAVIGLCSLGLLGSGFVAWHADSTRQAGYVDLGTATYRSDGYAVASGTVELPTVSAAWAPIKAFVGTVRVRVTDVGGTKPVFIGIGPATGVSRYLAGVARTTVHNFSGTHGVVTTHAGGAPATPPTLTRLWAASAAGAGSQAIAWPARSGNWIVVAMNADGSRPVSVRVNVAATVPGLPWIAGGLMAAGFIFLALSVALIAIPVRQASTAPGTSARQPVSPGDDAST